MRKEVMWTAGFGMTVLLGVTACCDAQAPTVVAVPKAGGDAQAPTVVAVAKAGWKRAQPLMFPGAKVQFPSIAAWVQGTPVTSWEPGGVCLIEFFQTNCGHCEESAPLMSEYARVFASQGVKFFAVTDEAPAVVAAWLAEDDRASRVTYPIAADPDKSTLKRFQLSTFQNPTPRVFIVKSGVVQWYGHPDELDVPLQGVLSGQWSPETIRAEFVLNSQERRARDEINYRLTECEKTGDWAPLRVLLDEVIAGFPERRSKFELMRFGALLGAMDQEVEGYAYGRTLEAQYAADPKSLRGLARNVLTGVYIEHRDVAWALQLAQRADALTQPSDAFTAETVALACWASGDREGALAALERAIQLDTKGKSRAEWSQKKALWQSATPGPAPSKPRNIKGNMSEGESAEDGPSVPITP